MAGPEDRIALERLDNLIKGFGWVIKNTQWGEQKIVVTVERKVTVLPKPPDAGPD